MLILSTDIRCLIVNCAIQSQLAGSRYIHCCKRRLYRSAFVRELAGHVVISQTVTLVSISLNHPQNNNQSLTAATSRLYLKQTYVTRTANKRCPPPPQRTVQGGAVFSIIRPPRRDTDVQLIQGSGHQPPSHFQLLHN